MNVSATKIGKSVSAEYSRRNPGISIVVSRRGRVDNVAGRARPTVVSIKTINRRRTLRPVIVGRLYITRLRTYLD